MQVRSIATVALVSAIGQVACRQLPAQQSAQSATMGCVRCMLRARQTQVIGLDPSHGTVSGYPPSAFRHRRGNLWVLDQTRGVAVIFGPDGRLLRLVGSRGDRVNDFTRPIVLLRGRADTMIVIDPTAQRRFAFSEDGRLLSARSQAGIGTRAALVLPDGRLVLNGVATDTENAGYRIRVESPGMASLYLDEDPRGFDARYRRPQQLVLAVTRDGGFLSVEPFGYVIKRYDRALREVWRHENRDFFLPLDRDESPTSGWDGRTPTMEVRAIWEDASGLILTATLVPSPTWRREVASAPTSSLAPDGTRLFPHQAKNRRFHTRIEVIDPTSHRVLAWRVLPFMAVHHIGGSELLTYEETDQGLPVMRAFSVEFDFSPPARSQ